jgi:hypothetical protein
MVTITAEVDVDVDLDEFDDTDLIDEMRRRNLSLQYGSVDDNVSLIQTMYEKYRNNQPIDDELRTFFYNSLGRIA